MAMPARPFVLLGMVAVSVLQTRAQPGRAHLARLADGPVEMNHRRSRPADRGEARSTPERSRSIAGGGRLAVLQLSGAGPTRGQPRLLSRRTALPA